MIFYGYSKSGAPFYKISANYIISNHYYSNEWKKYNKDKNDICFEERAYFMYPGMDMIRCTIMQLKYEQNKSSHGSLVYLLI